MSQPREPWNQNLPPGVKPLPPNWQQPITISQFGIYQATNLDFQSDTSPKRWYLYLVSVVSSALLVLGIFLPWITINLLGVGISVNAIGGISAPQSFIDSIQKFSSDFPSLASNTTTSATRPFDPRDGWILLILAVIIFVLAIGGMAQKSKVYSIGILICGGACLVLTGIDFWNTSKTIDDAYKSLPNPSANLFANIQIGFGLYIVLLSGIAAFVGAILTLTLFNSEPKRPPY